MGQHGAVKQLLKSIIARSAQYAAREFAEELAKQQVPQLAVTSAADTIKADPPGSGEGDRVKVDVQDLVKELGSGRLNLDLRHFYTWNHRWIAQLSERNRRAAVSTYDFVDSEMSQALFNLNQFAVIESKRDDMIEFDGYILDLGVYKGGSTRALARIFPDRHIHGFDSFEGLPGDWAHVLKGDFGDVAGLLPDMPDNVSLYKGWFDDSLPVWLQQHNDSPIAILRVDCDIYSSTKTIFDVLGPQLREGTWIVFDELIGYSGWEHHEHKAFMEFIDRTGYAYEYIAYGLTYTIARLGPMSSA